MQTSNLAAGKMRELLFELAKADLVLGVLNADGEQKLSSVNVHGRFVPFEKTWADGSTETMIAYVAPGESTPQLGENGEPLVHVHTICPWSDVRRLRVEDATDAVRAKIGADVRLNFLTQDPERLVFYFFGRSSNPALQELLRKHAWRPGVKALWQLDN